MFYFLEWFRKKETLPWFRGKWDFHVHIIWPTSVALNALSVLGWPGPIRLGWAFLVGLPWISWHARHAGGYRGHWAAVAVPRPKRCQLNNIVRRCDSLTKPRPGRSDTINLLFQTHWAMNTLKQRLRYSRRHTYSSHWIFYTERLKFFQQSVKSQRLSHLHLSSVLWHVVRPLTSRWALPNTRLFSIYNRIVISGRWRKGSY